MGEMGGRAAGRTGPGAWREGAGLARWSQRAAPEDIRAVALPVLRHRVLLNFQAEADGVDADQICRTAARSDRGAVTMSPPCPPEVLAGIADLELVARIVVEGLVSGLHRSPFHGYSAEFSQYRHYRPGDDLKYVDWKLAARTDRIYTKQFRETTNMASMLVLDTSASMAFPAAATKGYGPFSGVVEVPLRAS